DRVSKAIIEAKEKELHMLNQSKMAQMGEVLSMIAHQWRQPLTAISATASSMEIKIALAKFDEKYFSEHLVSIQEYSQHLSSTIDDFRNFFKDSKVAHKTTFEQIIKSTMSIINTSLQDRSITINIENSYIEPLCIYENEFKQVALNLFKNAEDALLENNIKNGMIKIKTYKKEQNAVFEIIDNAGGIKDEIAKQIFDPYFSTKDTKNGTGLGLYMSKTIIQEHCFGTLEHSNTEDGSKFTIVIDPNRFCDEANL
ncbi:MAG: HAMP domain-containing sensor histidine kinase, partial [Campylobacterota bacterium]|nr:HAMP domain-containing sensor histidine kinase [Campylobacterota bacterium]